MSDAVAAPDYSHLVDPLEQPIQPVRASALYRLALVLVAVAMVLLPLIYIGLIVVVGWGLYWHVTENVALFNAVNQGRGSMRVALFAYVTPIVVGSILLLFMIKPIFARRAKSAMPVSLDPAEEPALFAFVERLCAAVGAPRPRRIDVDHQVNASAGFRRGLSSLFRNDLVLTIGLPLVSGLTLRQLAGVLAHEFGHFAQGTGMRVTYVIRWVNHWFARVVYERDAWDVRLQRWSEDTDWRLAIVLYIARFFVWLTRRALWALMMAGHSISCLMLRTMEFDADRYEARVAGSEAFEATVYRLQELNAANQQAFSTLEHSWRSGQLVDDLPALIRVNVDRLPQQVGIAIQEHVRGTRTGAFDTHPADLDRIESARRERTQGIFRLQQDATVLFQDFEALCKRVTASFYRQQLDREVPTSRLVPTWMLVQGQEDLRAASHILQRYFNGAVPAPPVSWLPENSNLALPEDARGAYRDLQEARRQVEEGATEAKRRIESRQLAQRKATSCAQALRLLEAGYTIQPAEFGLREATVDDARASLERAVAELTEASTGDGEYTGAIRRRLERSLQLMHHPQSVTRLEDVDRLADEAHRLIAVLVSLQPIFDEIDERCRTFASLSVLIQAIQEYDTTDEAAVLLRSLSAELAGWLNRMRQHHATPLPFDGEASTVGEHIVDDLPAADDIGEVHNASSEAVDRLYSLHQRALAALIGLTIRVEGALGLPPLPEVDPRDRVD